MFRLFKEIQSQGGHEAVTRQRCWMESAARMGFPLMGKALHEIYLRYLGDFEVNFTLFPHHFKYSDQNASLFPPTFRGRVA